MPRSSVALCTLGSEAIKMYNQQFAVSAALVLLTDIIKLMKNNIGLQRPHSCHLLPLKETTAVLVWQIKISVKTKVLFSLQVGLWTQTKSHIFPQRYFTASLIEAFVAINSSVLLWHFYLFMKLSTGLNEFRDSELCIIVVLSYCHCSSKLLIKVF